MAKRPDWVMKSWTALNINEFILFDMFGSPCRRVVMFSNFFCSLLTTILSNLFRFFATAFVFVISSDCRLNQCETSFQENLIEPTFHTHSISTDGIFHVQWTPSSSPHPHPLYNPSTLNNQKTPFICIALHMSAYVSTCKSIGRLTSLPLVHSFIWIFFSILFVNPSGGQPVYH